MLSIALDSQVEIWINFIESSIGPTLTSIINMIQVLIDLSLLAWDQGRYAVFIVY